MVMAKTLREVSCQHNNEQYLEEFRSDQLPVLSCHLIFKLEQETAVNLICVNIRLC